MVLAALLVSLVALAVSVASVMYTRRQAEVAVSAERRANKPNLDVAIEKRGDEKATSVIYRIRNDGPIDLDRLVVFAPETDDAVFYAVAPVGGDYCDREVPFIEFEPLRMGHSARFVLALGAGARLPEFRVRLVSARGKDVWEAVEPLEKPRQIRRIIV